MAIYHYSVHKRVGRGPGRVSAVWMAAYMARDRFIDAAGEVHDFEPDGASWSALADKAAHDAVMGEWEHHHKPALWVWLASPEGTPEWTRGVENISSYWNRLEAFEKH